MIKGQDFFGPLGADSKLCMKIQALKYSLSVFLRIKKSNEGLLDFPDLKIHYQYINKRVWSCCMNRNIRTDMDKYIQLRKKA